MVRGTAPAPLICRGREFRWGERTYVMGIVNVSPESFSGDGLSDVQAAIEEGKRFVEEGADILDVGGQSTRPPQTALGEARRFGGPVITTQELPVEEELRRVLPVIEGLAAQVPVPISIDSYRGAVVREALRAGASLVNDVWGLRKDLGVARAAGEAGAPLILMHNQPTTEYRDLIPDILAGLAWSLQAAQEAGVPWDHLVVDPGFGFGKTAAQNLELLRRLGEFRALGRPLLLGTSRKATIGAVLGLPVDQRLEGTAATVALAIDRGVDLVRVHDVQAMVRVARMADAVVSRTGAGSL